MREKEERGGEGRRREEVEVEVEGVEKRRRAMPAVSALRRATRATPLLAEASAKVEACAWPRDTRIGVVGQDEEEKVESKRRIRK